MRGIQPWRGTVWHHSMRGRGELRPHLVDARGDADFKRARRVIILLLGILTLSLADLVLTVTHLRTLGMIESNPIAAFLIEHTRSWVILSLYKGLTVALCIALLYRARHQRIGEAGCWFALAILTWLSVVWHEYSIVIDQPELLQFIQAGAVCDQWHRLE